MEETRSRWWFGILGTAILLLASGGGSMLVNLQADFRAQEQRIVGLEQELRQMADKQDDVRETLSGVLTSLKFVGADRYRGAEARAINTAIRERLKRLESLLEKPR